MEYTPHNINITVLLTPGITIPADIKNPASTKVSTWGFWEEKEEIYSSSKVNPSERKKVRKNKVQYWNFPSSLAFFSNMGTLLKISPIKGNFVGTR